MTEKMVQTKQMETLVTNGLGGYSLLGVADIAYRKYHSLYTVSRKPPVDRVHVISKLALFQEVAGELVALNADQSSAQSGSVPQVAVSTTPITKETWHYDGLEINRTRAFKYQTHDLGLRYQFTAKTPMTLRLYPYFNCRDHHDAIPVAPKDYAFGWYKESHQLKMQHPLIQCAIQSTLPFHMALAPTAVSYYAIETERGYPDMEDHITPGYYALTLPEGETSIDFLISDESQHGRISGSDESVAAKLAHSQASKVAHSEKTISAYITEIFEAHKARILALEAQTTLLDQAFKPLVAASDQFIVWRETTDKKSILAGYPWFTDWGRDTMIAIPGLCLATGRYDDALEIIETFIAHQHKGIIPNNFPDAGEAPMYNTADATLWLYQAFFEYYKKTDDLKAVARHFEVLETMLNYHLNGTINDVFTDTDGLLSTGNPTTQLTWMDVKVNGWVVTPRHGKAVEINALFYNALSIMAYFAQLLNRPSDAKAHAEKLKVAFNQKFWNSEKGYLYDLIIDGEAIDILRPNMLFAISLPFPVLSKEHWGGVVDKATEALAIPYGLRSLDPSDPDYHGVYTGDLLARDGAYHRGTGWGWLIGPYLEAHFKAYGDREFVKNALMATLPHLKEGAIGNFAENFDGDAPYNSRGCSAQAWSVAEILRIMTII